MGGFKDILVMVGLQCIYAGFALFSKAAFDDGLNPQIYIVYRQVLATLLIAPLALLSNKKSGLTLRLELKTFGLIFAAALFGITINQSAYYEGIYFASATVASALVNLTSAVTFLMAVVVGLEKVNVWSLKGASKILGTIVSVAGAAAVSLLKGPVLVEVTVASPLRPVSSSLTTNSSTWLLGCLLVFGSCWCWSAWLVLQVPVTKNCPDHLYSTFLTCFFGSVQSTVLAIAMERQVEDWKLDTAMEYIACIFSGVASAVAFFGQAWCISRRGPVFSATFNPLSTVIVAIIGSIFLDETIYLGSLLGAMAIITGLYMVLWGKANDPIRGSSTINLEESLLPSEDLSTLEELWGKANDPIRGSSTINLEESLLPSEDLSTLEEESQPHPLSPYPSFASL